MGLNDKPWGQAETPADKSDKGKAAPSRQRSESDSSGLFAGLIFLLIIVILVGALVAGVITLGGQMFSHPGDNADVPAPVKTTPSPGAAEPVAYTPASIVRAGLPPDMFDRGRLKETDEIVGLWQSAKVFENGYWSDSDNFNLTIYNDNTYIVYDKAKQTYTTGTWKKNDPFDYNITEPGRDVPSRFTGDFSSLQLQYNVVGNDYRPGCELIELERIYYDGIYQDV